MQPTDITQADIDTSASLPLIGNPSGVTPSFFHMRAVATPRTIAEKNIAVAAAKTASAMAPYTPVRTPSTYRSTQAALQLNYGESRTGRISRENGRRAY